MVRYALYPSPFGMLQIGCEDEKVVSISSSVNCGTHDPSPVSERANAQLQEYFLGKRSSFDFPMKPAGTPFQLAVWNQLLQIPYGETRTYGQIAAAIGKPGAAVAKERYFNLTLTDLNAPNQVVAFNEVKHAYIP